MTPTIMPASHAFRPRGGRSSDTAMPAPGRGVDARFAFQPPPSYPATGADGAATEGPRDIMAEGSDGRDSREARDSRRAFWRGFRDALPFLVVIVPFGMVFGVLAAEAGWPMLEILAMSFFVIAGASQFTALQLLSENAPLMIVIATGLAVNLRMAMYSASLAPHIGGAPFWQRALAAYVLTDQCYGIAINRYTLQPTMSMPAKMGYFLGVAAPVVIPWYFATDAGAAAGAAIPQGLALDFAVPITFLALFAPALRSLPHLAAAIVSVVVSLALAWMPYNLWLLIAGLLAMATGALVEVWLERRR
jgi:4-azaleucine resistance transporter AzlC